MQSSPQPWSDALRDDGGASLPGTGQRAFWVGLVLVVLSLISALATYSILTGLTSIVPRDGVVLVVLAINIVLILAMLGLLIWQAMGLQRAWRNKVAGARLHIRIVSLFTVITALPAIFLAMAATTTFSRALDGWFSSRVRSMVENSSEVARAYVEEHGQVIRTDAVNMARDLDDALKDGEGSPAELRAMVLSHAGLRELPSAYLVDRQGRQLMAVLEHRRIPFEPLPEAIMAQADAGQVPLLLPGASYRVGAVAKLTRLPGRFLLIARPVQEKVVRQMHLTDASVAEYRRLRQARGPLKLVHGVMYALISLTAVLAAIWVGMWFASRFVAPIRRLIAAAQQVSRGNLEVKLPINRGEGDLRRLSATFNQMTTGLQQQQSALVRTNAELAERRQFIEAVLEGVTAGVIGLDGKHVITLANASAERLLGRSAGDLIDRPLAAAVPELGALVQTAGVDDGRDRVSQQEVTIVIGREERSFSVRLTAGHWSEAAGSSGLVVTFDDITELVSAQRTAAWADVARRIAHEIKNPLTPIQLSAERLRRKYGKVIQDDREVFDKCTETIIRQVGDVARMVDEFSAFARMPKPELGLHDIRDVVRDAVVLYQMSETDIRYDLELPKQKLPVTCDRRLVSQAITNLVKNAGEAIQSLRDSGQAPEGHAGRVSTRVREAGENVVIEVVDNGIGLPRQNRARLLEPYVTTRVKGTGLGLAIVQKVIEQHGGILSLEDAPASEGWQRGAMVRVTLPRADTMAEPALGEAGQAAAREGGTPSPARERPARFTAG